MAVACVEVAGDDGAPLTGLTLDEARTYAAGAGARLPTEFEWQLAATDPGFRRAEPLVWNWTESEHSDGITRFAILKGGCCVRGRRVGVVLRRRSAATRVQRQAVARRARRRPLAVDRLPPRLGSR